VAVCRIISPNRLRGDDAHIESTTFDIKSLPASNLLHPNLFMVARSHQGYGQNIVFDLLRPLSVQAVAVLAHTIPSNPTKLRFAGHTSDDWTSPASGWLSLSWNADKIIGFFSAEQTYRFWCLEVNASAQFDIGGMVFGPYYQPSLELNYTELTPFSRPSRDGRMIVHSIATGFRKVPQAERKSLAEIYERHYQFGEFPYQMGSEPTMFIFDATSKIVSDGLQEYSLYGVISGEFSTPLDQFNHADKISLVIEECK